MTLVHGLGEGKGDAGPGSAHGSLFDAEVHGDGVGGLKADATDVARQSGGVLRHDLHGVGTIGLVDAHRPRCPNSVHVQVHHDLAHDVLLGPGVGDAFG